MKCNAIQKRRGWSFVVLGTFIERDNAEARRHALGKAVPLQSDFARIQNRADARRCISPTDACWADWI